MSKDNKEKRIVTFVSKETLTNLKISALQNDTTLQLETRKILEKAMSKKNKLSELSDEVNNVQKVS